MGKNINHTTVKNGKAAAVCCCCNKHSRPATVDKDGEPDLWDMTQGWSQTPFPAESQHSDGSHGSQYTCPDCNKKLRRGETLLLRGVVLSQQVAV
jgi:hypothetical protein